MPDKIQCNISQEAIESHVVAGDAQRDFLRAKPNTPVQTQWKNTITTILRVGDRDIAKMSASEWEAHQRIQVDAANSIWDAVMEWKRRHGLDT